MPYSGDTTSYGSGENLETYFVCDECGYEHSFEASANECCEFQCGECGERYSDEDDADSCCNYHCVNCGEQYSNEESAMECCADSDEEGMSATYPSHLLNVQPEYRIYVPEIEGRPARPCSVEQELCSGKYAIASMLYDLGLAPDPNIQGYSRDIERGRIAIKEDGTLPDNGGEVVYSRFNLSDPQMVEKFSKAAHCMRELKAEGITHTDTSAGTHIHIGALPYSGYTAQIFSPAQMASLYEIFSFAEDVLFRLAAAGWSEHRGRRYSDKLNKFDKVTAGKVAVGSQRHRYFSLNFQRLLKAASSCSCGACLVGDWAECECGCLNGGTVEWRIFNATTKPETLHAWLLLTHGITAASFAHQMDTLEPNSFEETPAERHPWILGWLLWNCPFTDEERQVIIDCAKRSPGLAIDWPEFEENHERWGQMEMPPTPEPEAEVPDRYTMDFDFENNEWVLRDANSSQTWRYLYQSQAESAMVSANRGERRTREMDVAF